MKAPSADYSSLSQALSAKNSAIQTSYSAKDASNWKSSYDIQQKSFQLSRDSLNLQKEQTNVSGALNTVSAVTNLVDKSASFYQALASVKQDDLTQKLTRNSTEMSSQWENLVQLNPDYITETTDPVTGGTTLTLSEKGKTAYSNLEAQYFPEGTKYGWGMDKEVENMKQNLRVNCMSYAQTIALNNIKGDADNNFAYNLEYAKQVDLNSGETEDVTVNDGTGTMRTLPLGKRTKMVIDSRAASAGWSQTRIETEYLKAAQEFSDARKTWIAEDLSAGFTNGTYINGTEDREKAYKTMDAYLETIEDDVERERARQSFVSAIDSATQQYYTNAIATAKAGATPYDSLQELYASVSDKGKDASGKSFTNKGLFYTTDPETGKDIESKYISSSTLNTIRSAIKTEMDTLEKTAGTVATDTVNSSFTLWNAKLKDGSLSAEGWVANVEGLLSSEDIYGPDWRNNPEAMKVYQENVMNLLPENMKSDPIVKSSIAIAVNSMFQKEYSDLSDNDRNVADRASTSMMQEMIAAALQDPTVAIDTTKFAQTIDTIAKRYDAVWVDLIDDVFKADFSQTVGGQEAEKVFEDEIDKVLSNSAYAEGISERLSEDGTWDRSVDVLGDGVNEIVTDYIVGLGQNGEMADKIEDARTGSIRFMKDEDGSLELSTVTYKGKDVPGMDSVSVIYNAQTGEWKYDGTPTPMEELPKTTATGETPPNLTNVGDVSAAFIADVESGNVSKATSDVADEAVSTVNDDIDTFLTNGMNNATEGGLETFLWNMATTETRLDETAEKLKEKHAEGEYAPGMSEAEFDSQMTTVLNRIKQNKGWTENSTTTAETATVTAETKTEKEEVKTESTTTVEQKEPTTNSKGVQAANDFLKKNKSTSQMQLLATLSQWKDAGKLDGSYEVLKNAIANGNLIIETGSSLMASTSKNPYEILDDIYEQVTKGKTNGK